VLCLKQPDVATLYKARYQDWIDTFNAEVSPFFVAVSEGKLSLVFRLPQYHEAAPPNDWIPRITRQEFLTENVFIGTNTLDTILFPEIDSVVNFTGVDFFVTVLGNDSGGNGIAAFDPWHPLISYGTFTHAEATGMVINGKKTENMAYVHVGENANRGVVDGMEYTSSVVLEEIGHALGFDDDYWSVQPIPGGASRSHTTGYSPMDRWPAFPTAMHTHLLSWEQIVLRWLGTAGAVDSLIRNSTPVTRTLTPLANQSPAPGENSVIALPHEGTRMTGFRGYTIEARIRDMSSLTTDSVFQSGVVVTWVDSTHPEKARRLTVQQDPNQPTANGLEFALEVGDVFQDLARGVQVSVTGQGSDTYDVEVLFDEAGMKPDLSIQKWQPPDWETPDIWINNFANDSGGRVYQFPDGNRDILLARADPMDAPVPHDIHYRFRNLTSVSANNVSVRAYWADAGMAQTSWNLIGTNVYSLVPGSPSPQTPTEVEGFIAWEPRRHCCSAGAVPACATYCARATTPTPMTACATEIGAPCPRRIGDSSSVIWRTAPCSKRPSKSISLTRSCTLRP